LTAGSWCLETDGGKRDPEPEPDPDTAPLPQRVTV
jgi:hypothetical protein